MWLSKQASKKRTTRQRDDDAAATAHVVRAFSKTFNTLLFFSREVSLLVHKVVWQISHAKECYIKKL
jgi:hypothetical protein